MTLEEFMKHFRGLADSFELDWKDGNDDSPDDFPIEMGVEDWFEQFNFYLNSEDPDEECPF